MEDNLLICKQVKKLQKGQQYAELVGEKVKLEGVDAEEVTDKTGLDEITGNDADKGWEYTYEISEGTEDEDGNVFKVATIKNLQRRRKIALDILMKYRYLLQVAVFSVPIGGIIAYTGSLRMIPSKLSSL